MVRRQKVDGSLYYAKNSRRPFYCWCRRSTGHKSMLPNAPSSLRDETQRRTVCVSTNNWFNYEKSFAISFRFHAGRRLASVSRSLSFCRPGCPAGQDICATPTLANQSMLTAAVSCFTSVAFYYWYGRSQVGAHLPAGLQQVMGRHPCGFDRHCLLFIHQSH